MELTSSWRMYSIWGWLRSYTISGAPANKGRRRRKRTTGRSSCPAARCSPPKAKRMRSWTSGSRGGRRTRPIPACAQWSIFSIVRANFQKYDLYSAPIARGLPRYIVPFFKFFKTGKCFKTMLFPVSCVSQKPLAFQKHSLLLIQTKTHAKTLSERSEKCATVHVLTGTDIVARATYLQRAL